MPGSSIHVFNYCALLVGAKNTYSAIKTPIFQMEKLKPSQVKALAQASREDRSLEEIRAPDSRLGFCLGPTVISGEKLRALSAPWHPPSHCSPLRAQ